MIKTFRILTLHGYWSSSAKLRTQTKQLAKTFAKRQTDWNAEFIYVDAPIVADNADDAGIQYSTHLYIISH